ncbi:MAG: glycosyltransferase family protein [bacterium]|nr:glycosyltransferase family protein [bacterium]
MKRKVVCIIQARIGSTRLPGKVLLPLEGKAVILHDVDRVLAAKTVDAVVVATTVQPADQKIIDVINGYDARVSTFRGSEEDVLDRYYKAAKEAQADVVIRITSDCPLIDPVVIDRVVSAFLDTPDIDYVANVLGEHTYPNGMDIEVVAFPILEQLWKNTTDPFDREHVTVYIKKYPEQFKTKNIKNGVDYSFHRWTLDEEKDFQLISYVYKKLYAQNPLFTMEDVLKLFDENPALITMNQDVQQKNPQFG